MRAEMVVTKGFMEFRRVLKDVSTGLYLDGSGKWVADETQAHNYKSAMEAVRAGRKLGSSAVHLVLKFGDSRVDLSCPVCDEERPRPANPVAKSSV